MTTVYILIFLWFVLMVIFLIIGDVIKKQKQQEREKEKVKDSVMLIKLGDKIEIVEMVGEPDYKGKTGIVKQIDDYGLLHGTWGELAVDLHKDTIKVIKNEKVFKK